MEKIIKQYINVERVKLLMKEKNISEKELANRMCMTLSTIKKLLGGADQRRMSGIVLYKLAKTLDVTAHSLLHEEYR